LVGGVHPPTEPTAKSSMTDRTTAPKAGAIFITPLPLAAPNGKGGLQWRGLYGLAKSKCKLNLRDDGESQIHFPNPTDYRISDVDSVETSSKNSPEGSTRAVAPEVAAVELPVLRRLRLR